MFERFTNHARHVVVLSQEEARRLHHNYIGTEHILLGLLGERSGIAFRVLDGLGMTLDGVRQEVTDVVGPWNCRCARRWRCATTSSARSTSCSASSGRATGSPPRSCETTPTC